MLLGRDKLAIASMAQGPHNGKQGGPEIHAADRWTFLPPSEGNDAEAV
jgi:hypothetical protein